MQPLPPTVRFSRMMSSTCARLRCAIRHYCRIRTGRTEFTDRALMEIRDGRLYKLAGHGRLEGLVGLVPPQDALGDGCRLGQLALEDVAVDRLRHRA